MKPGEGFLRKKAKAVHDEHLICREIFNPNKFAIVFRRNIDKDIYIMRAGIPLGELIMICNPESFLFLPHGYFLPRAEGVPDGEQVSIITNFGDSIGKGNRNPSALGLG